MFSLHIAIFLFSERSHAASHTMQANRIRFNTAHVPQMGSKGQKKISEEGGVAYYIEGVEV